MDRIIERDSRRLVAVKAVTRAEEYLSDHFPTFPVLPGVLMLETLVQAGRALVAGMDVAESLPAASANPAGANPGAGVLVLAEVRNVRYGNMVRPGQTLVVEVTLKAQHEDAFDLVGVGKVDGQVAVQGRFTLAPPPAET
jgi:3-hydroxyacyl-[acyl-carrier-protein] dehydratase